MATVNVDLRVGSLEETITVTGESPIVDVQSARTQQIIDKDALAAIPSSRNINGIQAMIPGMTAQGDSGGINGDDAGRGRRHPRRAHERFADLCRWHQHGLGRQQRRRRADAAGGRRAGSRDDHSGGLAEAETSGVIFNAVPREGSNRFTGQFNYTGSSGTLQGSNYTQELQNAGLRAPFELINLYDVSGMYGGRIMRDKLWFYTVYRQVGGERTVPGMFYNKNAGNPNSWLVDFDRSQQAFTNSLERQVTIRLTWQATPRNKFNVPLGRAVQRRQLRSGGRHRDGDAGSVEPRTFYIPSRQPHASWQSPITGQIAGRGRLGHVSGPVPLRHAQRRLAQSGDDSAAGAGQPASIPGLISRMPRAPGQGGFTHSLIGNLASLRASLTYVTGSHNMKFGYQGGFGNPSQTYQSFTQVVQVRTLNGVPNQLTQTIMGGPDTKYVRNLIPTNFYAQDQWTTGRLTLQGGVRYDSLISNYPDQRIGGPGWPYAPKEIFFPSRSTPGYEWKDLTPRVGVAYDLFGNGKTATQVQHRQIPRGDHGKQQRPGHEPDHSHGRELDTRVDRRGQGLRAGLRSQRTGGERRVCGAGQSEPGTSGVHSQLRSELRHRLGHAAVQLVDGLRCAARSDSARLGDRHLQSQLVGQLVRRGQPVDQSPPTTRHTHHRAARSTASGWRRLPDRRLVQPGADQGRTSGRTRTVLQELR